jgi:acetoin utilization deacetylase AcuC-like enzyme
MDIEQFAEVLRTGDTAICPDSYDVAMDAVGSSIAVVDAVLADTVKNAFCAIRPPGHHASAERGMGFCIFNSIAIAALVALQIHKLDRVAILDFDVHHGNGTVDIFASDPRVLVCSTFQHPFYPNRHTATIADNIVNCPLATGSGSREFRGAVERYWGPALARHDAQLILVSAGFDAHALDPVGGLCLREADFRWVTQFICAAAATTDCGGRIVSVLEGGYALDALARSVASHIEGLLED